MNEKVCRLCKRYAGRSAMVRGWLCARWAHRSPSAVVPGHSYVERDMLHPIMKSRKEPPEWCERPLEQVLLGPDDDVDIQGDKALIYDGNQEAERHSRRWTSGKIT